MRVAHVLRRLSFDDWGGTEQVVWNLARAQVRAGHEVRIFATTALCPTPRETREGLEILRFPPVYPWWPMTAATRARLDRKGGNPFVPGLARALRDWAADVIHCHAMGRIAELCIRVAEKTGARCAVSLHGGGANVPAAEAASLRAPTRRLLPWGKLLDKALRRTRRVPEDAGGIVCVGEDEADLWRARHPRVLFLPNGVDVALFEGPDPTTQRSNDPTTKRSNDRTIQRPNDPTRVLCVARIDRQKNQMALVEALARDPRLAVRLVGPATEPDYLEALRARAAELGAADRLSIAGALPPGSPELAAEYRAADVFALPSRHEPFGIVVLEAWAAGLPVVASNVGGLGRLCAAHPGAALVFDPADPSALSAALSRVLADPALAASLAAAGRAAARDYDWTALAARLSDFYTTLPGRAWPMGCPTF